MKKSIVAVVALTLAASFSPASLANDNAPQAPAEGLVEVKKGAFQSTWVNPEVDFRQYNKLVIAEQGAVEFRDVGPAKKSRSRPLMSNERYFGIGDEDRERFERFAAESFSKQLNRSKKFDILEQSEVESIPADMLILRAHVIDIASKVAPPMSGSNAVYSNDFGEATFILELIDPASGKVVAYAAERSRIQRAGHNDVWTMSESNSVTAWAEVKRWAGRVGSRLARELDASHKV